MSHFPNGIAPEGSPRGVWGRARLARPMEKIELLDGVAEVAPEDWNALVGDESPFLEWF